MTSARDNELLTRIGPGTPMGQLMREYWVPFCLSSEVKAGGAPVRIMLLGEKLVAFRDSSGRVGLLAHNCPHRCASLFFGRNEAGGLRCVYHGWKFDVDGNCLEMPNVPPHQQFHTRVKAKAYRTQERQGIVYAYLGSRAEAPSLPQLEVLLLPEADVIVRAHQRECNWLQSLEGEIDTSHFGFLHTGSVTDDQVDPSNVHKFTILNRQPEYFTAETDWGTMYAAHRPADPGETYFRFSHFLFPFWTMFPDGDFEDNIVAQSYVPMDDTHTMVFSVFYKQRTPAMRRLKDGAPIPGLEPDANLQPMQLLPNTTDWFGRFRTVLNKSNDYMIDREVQSTRSYSGISTVPAQDQAMVEGMGDIVDRTLEHLAPSDRMVTLTRRRLIRAARAFAEEKITPPALDNPTVCHGARGGSFVAPSSMSWLDAYAHQIRTARNPAGVLHAAE